MRKGSWSRRRVASVVGLAHALEKSASLGTRRVAHRAAAVLVPRSGTGTSRSDRVDADDQLGTAEFECDPSRTRRRLVTSRRVLVERRLPPGSREPMCG